MSRTSLVALAFSVLSLAHVNLGINEDTNIPMITTTINISMSVNHFFMVDKKN